MKAQRRHDLQNNSLANFLEDPILKIKPYLPLISIGLVLFLGLLIAYNVYSGMAQQTQNNSWETYLSRRYEHARSLSAGKPEGETIVLQSILDDKAAQGGSAADWARLELANSLTNQALSNRWNRDGGYLESALLEPLSLFEEILEKAPPNSALSRFAAFGKARAADGMLKSQKEIDGLIGQYEHVANTWPLTLRGQLATSRIEQLKLLQEEETDSVAWLATQDFSPILGGSETLDLDDSTLFPNNESGESGLNLGGDIFNESLEIGTGDDPLDLEKNSGEATKDDTKEEKKSDDKKETEVKTETETEVKEEKKIDTENKEIKKSDKR
ncbi:MAG: hypothetical protein MPJ24_07135 [Pirellulaceae bacterium]|nr:hypothetical protein [Pirellulaceae bacterium]